MTRFTGDKIFSKTGNPERHLANCGERLQQIPPMILQEFRGNFSLTN